jgi:hypothetical protein
MHTSAHSIAIVLLYTHCKCYYATVSVDDTGAVSLDGQKLLNLAVLVTAGLWMTHSILTVDADIWRGWTWQEVLLRLPYDNWGM